jgi:uncharacterized protein (TIGR03083 family)
MDDASRLAELVETWRAAVADFVALARSLPEQTWDLPTDLAGWSVKDNVAHTAHLEAVLAGAPEETVEVIEADHLTGLMGLYTEQGVLARRDRSVAELADELETAAAKRYAELTAEPPTDASSAPPKTPGDVPWDFGTLLRNRPFDVWMHEQDIRRAVGRPGGYDTAACRHALWTLGRGLPMIVGKRVAPPVGTTVRIDVPDAGESWTVVIGDDGRAAVADPVDRPTVRITLSAEDFVVLGGGRRDVAATSPAIEGDAELGAAVLANLAVTP